MRDHSEFVAAFARKGLYIILPFILNSCFIFGLHRNDYNPAKPGKYDEFDLETKMLGAPTALRTGFDVTFYQLDIEIYPDKKEIAGWVEIGAKALTEIDSVQIDLASHLIIDELRWEKRDGESLNYSRTCRAVFIKLPSVINKGQSFKIQVHYSGKPQIATNPPWYEGMVWKKDKNRKDWIGVTCESDGGSLWFPCKDMTSDEPDSAEMRFTIPDTSLMIVSNGVLTKSEITEKGKSVTWKTHYPINVYNITFYAGDFAKIEDTYIGVDSQKLALTYYVLKSNEAKAREHFKQNHDILKTYEELFGDYPWYRDGFKLIESPYSGMEHQTAIAFGSQFTNMYYFNNDYILVHESAHEWFGNALTANDFADIWLQEGFATYAEALFFEKKFDKAAALNYMLFDRMMIKNKYPLIGPENLHYFDPKKSGDAYIKGAWVLHTLRNVINNDVTFFSIIRTFYNENKYQTTTTKEFIDCVNRISGQDFNWFFNTYLYRNTIPVLEIENEPNGDMYYRWVNVGEDFNKMQVCGQYRMPDGARDFKIYPNTTVAKFKVMSILTKDDIKYSISEQNSSEPIIPLPVYFHANFLYKIKQNSRLHKIYLKQGGN